MRKNIKWEKGKWEEISSSLKILRLLGRISSGEERNGHLEFWEENKDETNGNGEEYKVVACRELYTPLAVPVGVGMTSGLRRNPSFPLCPTTPPFSI